MHELPLENQRESKREINLEELNFEELKEVSEKAAKLARSSFKETESGFQNANGNGIIIIERNNKYEIGGIADNLKEFHFYALVKADKKLQKDFDSKEELMQEIRKMIEETGNRIIE